MRRPAVVGEDVRAEDGGVGDAIGDAGSTQGVVTDEEAIGNNRRRPVSKDIPSGVARDDRVPRIPGGCARLGKKAAGNRRRVIRDRHVDRGGRAVSKNTAARIRVVVRNGAVDQCGSVERVIDQNPAAESRNHVFRERVSCRNKCSVGDVNAAGVTASVVRVRVAVGDQRPIAADTNPLVAVTVTQNAVADCQLLAVADCRAIKRDVSGTGVSFLKRQAGDRHDLHSDRAVVDQEDSRADPTVRHAVPAAVDDRARRAVAGDGERRGDRQLAPRQQNRVGCRVGEVRPATRRAVAKRDRVGVRGAVGVSDRLAQAGQTIEVVDDIGIRGDDEAARFADVDRERPLEELAAIVGRPHANRVTGFGGEIEDRA